MVFLKFDSSAASSPVRAVVRFGSVWYGEVGWGGVVCGGAVVVFKF